MENETELIPLAERVMHKYVRAENIKRTYGTEKPLSKSEIHTVDAVGDNPNINITSLAETLGVTKGAASQMIYKLVGKGLIDKRVSPNSDSEVVLNLTDEGLINYKSHKEFHRQANDKLLAWLDGLTPNERRHLTEFFSAFEKMLDSQLAEN